MSEKAKSLTFADLLEALKNFPKFADVIKEEGDDWSSAMKIWKDRVYAWKEDFEGLVLELQKQLQDTSEKEVDRINDLIREKAKTIRLVTRDEKTAFVCGFKMGHSTRTQEFLGETKR